MNASKPKLSAVKLPKASCATCARSAPRNDQAMMRALLGLLLLSVAGCARQPVVVEVDRPIWIPPPSVCLLDVTWDADADPATNGALLDSWDLRGAALTQATGQLACLRGWSADMAKALPGRENLKHQR
jgi:hypothetical protein